MSGWTQVRRQAKSYIKYRKHDTMLYTTSKPIQPTNSVHTTSVTIATSAHTVNQTHATLTLLHKGRVVNVNIVAVVDFHHG